MIGTKNAATRGGDSTPRPQSQHGHSRSSRWIIAVAVVTILPLAVTPIDAADQKQKPKDRDADLPIVEVTTRGGIVLIDQQYLPSPYRLGVSQDGVTINGILIRTNQWNLDFFESESSDEELRLVSRTDRGHSADATASRKGGRSRRRRPRPSRPPQPSQSFTFADIAQQLVTCLNANAIVVVGPDRATVLMTYADQMTFLAAASKDEQIIKTAKQEGWLDQSTYDAFDWAHRVDSPIFTSLVQERITALSERAGEDMEASIALRRMNRWEYPLSLLGMVLGVFGVGHLLRSAPRVQTEEQRRETSEQWVQLTRVSIVLFVVMSSLDLAWTLIASSAGQMRELNPIGRLLIESPEMLVAFKLAATFMSGLILYRLRFHRQAQTASWWACLLLTLLTLRWVVFNSMFIS